MGAGAAVTEAEVPVETPAVEPETPPVEPPAEDPPAVETKEGEDTPADEETPEEKPAAEAEERKRRGGFQRKIEKLERDIAARDALLAARQAQPQTPTEPKEQTANEKAAAYIAAQVEQKLAEREAVRAQAEAQAAFAQRMAAARQVHADFDDVVLAADAPVAPAVGEALLTSEHGPEIMYSLASNPGELARLNALSPVAAAREIGKLEAKFASAPAPKPPVVAARKPPPAPITPVQARGVSNVKPVSQMTQAEFNAWRNSGGGR